MKTLKYFSPMLLMISTLLVIEGCYTSFAVPNQSVYETYADDSEVAFCDSVAGPGLVYHEDRYADNNCDPGVRIIVYERPSWISYNDPWDNWYFGFGLHDWYGGYRHSYYYDPWWGPCIFPPTPVVYHSYYWGHPWYRTPWRHHWAYDPWPVYHHMPSHSPAPIHARVQPKRRTFDRRDRTVAVRAGDRRPANKTVVRSTPTKNTPLAKGNSRTESRNANRRTPVTIRDIRHTEPAARSRTSGSVQKSTAPKPNAASVSRSESRRKPLVVQKESGGGKSAQPQKAVRQTKTQTVRTVVRTRPSAPVRVQTTSRPEPKKSQRASVKKPSVQNVRTSRSSSVSSQSSNSTSRRASVSRSSGSRTQSSSPKAQSGSSRSSNSGSSRRSRR